MNKAEVEDQIAGIVFLYRHKKSMTNNRIAKIIIDDILDEYAQQVSRDEFQKGADRQRYKCADYFAVHSSESTVKNINLIRETPLVTDNQDGFGAGRIGNPRLRLKNNGG